MVFRRFMLLAAVVTLSIVLTACAKKTPGVNTQVVSNTLNQPTNTSAPQPSESDSAKKDVLVRRAFVINFVQRYGSYSNEALFQNVEDLYSQMTDSLQAYAQQMVTAGRQNAASDKTYYGTTTYVRTVKSETASDQQVRYLLATQRVERTGDTERSYYQDITVVIKKVGSEWKVDQAQWAPATQQ